MKAVNALPDYRLSVQFTKGVTKIYDVNYPPPMQGIEVGAS